MHRDGSGTMMALFRLLFENVVQPIQEDGGVLQVVPNSERAQNSRIRHCRERAKCNKLTDAQVTVNDLGSTDPEENGRGEKPDGLEVREITFKSAIFDKRVRISSWIPSAK